MAQYDVYINPSSSTANGIPFVVVIQSDLLDALSTRLTMPLAATEFTGKVPTALCPVITVNGQRQHSSLYLLQCDGYCDHQATGEKLWF